MHATTRYGQFVCPSSGSRTKRINGFLFLEGASPFQTESISYFSVIIPNSGKINARILIIKILLKLS